MAWDDAAQTITSGCFNPSKGRFLHPEEDRAITMREAAFDQSILGIRPDYIVKIRPDIRYETDGPMLKHGLQGLHNTRIVIPKSKRLRPALELLERRWEQFTAAA